MPLISVLIVVYNPGDELKHCLGNLLSHTETINLEVIVVDNHSSKNVMEQFSPAFPDVKFIRSEKNLGFGGGNNLAFAHSSGEYIFCLNPDVMLKDSTLTTMLAYIQQNETVGIVGPKTIDMDGNLTYTARSDYTIARLCAKYSGLSILFTGLVYGDYPKKMRQATESFEVDWLQGSCLLMSHNTYQQVNGFDETFFLYMEDTDICRRVRETGLKVIYLPEAVVSHLGGETTSKYPFIRVKSYHHSPIHYHRKQGNHVGVWLLKLLFAIELFAKILIRLHLYQIRQDESIRQHYLAEIKTLKQLRQY